MRGLLSKTVHETWVATLLFGCGLFAVMALLTYVVPQFHEGMSELFEHLPFVKTLLAAMLGTEVGDEINARTMQAVLWVHPMVLALAWAHAIVFCTRMPAGEIDRGTIDILLGLPAPRRAVYYSEVAVWLVAGLAVLLMGMLGHLLTASAIDVETRPSLTDVLRVMGNLYCVYVAVGGIALLFSSLSNHRGRAMGAAFALVVASFLLSFVSQFWAPAKTISFVSVLEYYRPAEILLNGAFPTRDAAALLSVGVASLALGGEIMARRSICTV